MDASYPTKAYHVDTMTKLKFQIDKDIKLVEKYGIEI